MGPKKIEKQFALLRVALAILVSLLMWDKEVKEV